MKRLGTNGMFAMPVTAVFVAAIMHGTTMAQTPDPSTPSSIPAKDGAVQSSSGSTQKPGAEILSDTMGVDFSGYLSRLRYDIQHNWDKLVPAEVLPPQSKKGIVGIRFTILPDGKIGSMTLESRSGDVALDKAAWTAITSEGQFPPLPREFHGPLLELRLGFFYNTPTTPAK